MKNAGLPPHIANMAKPQIAGSDNSISEEVDIGSTFSDTVTEKIRVKVSSHFDAEKSEPDQGKYMFWYKVGIYNEGPEPVQVVARMWEIEKCKGEKETVRGQGILSTQPIIAPGDVFTYQSVCPLKVFPPKGKRVLGNMSGAYTMCKGNMGQHNFTVKVGKFNLILPETAVSPQ
jgi:ApaG protein